MNLIARFLPSVLWLAVLSQAVLGGLSVPRATSVLAFPPTSPLLLVFFAFGVVSVFLLRAQEPRQLSFWKRAAEVLNEPEFAGMERRIRFPLLAAVFFTLAGAIASVGCQWVGAPAANVAFSRMPLMAGLGMFLGLALVHRRAPSRSA